MSDDHKPAVMLRDDGSVSINWPEVERRAAAPVLDAVGVMARALMFVRNQQRPEPTTRIMAVEVGTGIDEHAVRAAERERIIAYVEKLQRTVLWAEQNYRASGQAGAEAVSAARSIQCAVIIHGIREMGGAEKVAG